ncbi:OsmC family protein [Specibacter cremeus]|uniref:OsmC family protein n=1 Tax=Specibacter cremeus TaxID=1629051 RepID=UPI000F7B9F7D|nr:OsmC family protein [Specibacter cremeus]
MTNGIDTDALSATIEAVKNQPELAQVSFNVHSQWTGGCHQRATTGELIQNGSVVESRQSTYVLESDEPAALLGTDKAANPAEYILHALAGCYSVTYASLAATEGIELDSLRLELAADLDLQGFLNLNDEVRPGISRIRVDVHATSPNATDAQLAALTRAVQERSPIRDTLAGAVDVQTVLVRD